MRPRLLVKPTTAMAVPPGATTSPARPLTSAGRARRANGRPRHSTIEYHLSHVYVKLGFRGRVELAGHMAGT